MRTTLLSAVSIVAFTVTQGAPARGLGPQHLPVDTRGVTASILYEAPIEGGHLPELVGKYKLRLTEITVAASGYIGEHNHRGPGIRQMTEGEMDYVMPHATVTYRPGDFFFETGDVSHRVLNDTNSDCKHLLFEILPLDVEGPSLVPPRESAPGSR